MDIHSLLTSDARFLKRGKALLDASTHLNEVLLEPKVVEEIDANVFAIRNLCKFLNVLQYANFNDDSFVSTKFETDKICEVIKSGDITKAFNYEHPIDSELADYLKDDYISFKEMDIKFNPDMSKEEFRELFMKPSKKKVSSSTSTTKPGKKKSTRPSGSPKKLAYKDFDKDDEEFWIESVRLDVPLIPQPDSSDVVEKFKFQENEYCIYGEGNLPWLQCQITCLTDINQFSSKDIMKLYPPIRLYTRSPYMYKQYEGLEYDEDLGVIIPIGDYDKVQLMKNLIEYPHIDMLMRSAKVKGKDILVPFWKHIEIDGEIHPTAQVWESLPGTENLPKTESFMNEYVVRKYLLDIEHKGLDPKYPMYGSLGKFLTLYAPNSYYEDKLYDSLELGRKCIESRKDFKLTRNPILRLKNEIAGIE